MISMQLQGLCFITSVIFLWLTVRLVKRNVLNLKYSFIWLLVSCGCVIISVFPQNLNMVKNIVGTEIASNAIFLIAFYFIIVLLFGLTTIVSRQDKKLKVLNQELAILKMKVEKHE